MAISAREFQLLSVQATLFTRDVSVSSALMLTKLFPIWGGRFDGEPTVLTLPKGVPGELPGLTLRSASGEWSAQIAAARVNVIWNKAAGAVAPAAELGQILKTSSDLLLEYYNVAGTQVTRLAVVINRFALCDEPARFLANHFGKERWSVAPFNRPENFELHAHKTYRIGDGEFEVNSWVRNKSGKLTSPSKAEQPIVVVEQDVNTLAIESDDFSFSIDQVKKFFALSDKALDETLGIYYPVEDR